MSLHCFFFCFPVTPLGEKATQLKKHSQMQVIFCRKANGAEAHKQIQFTESTQADWLQVQWEPFGVTLKNMNSYSDAWSKHKRRLTAAADVCVLRRAQRAVIFSWLKQFNNHTKIHIHDILYIYVMYCAKVLFCKQNGYSDFIKYRWKYSLMYFIFMYICTFQLITILMSLVASCHFFKYLQK